MGQYFNIPSKSCIFSCILIVYNNNVVIFNLIQPLAAKFYNNKLYLSHAHSSSLQTTNVNSYVKRLRPQTILRYKVSVVIQGGLVQHFRLFE